MQNILILLSPQTASPILFCLSFHVRSPVFHREEKFASALAMNSVRPGKTPGVSPLSDRHLRPRTPPPLRCVGPKGSRTQSLRALRRSAADALLLPPDSLFCRPH